MKPIDSIDSVVLFSKKILDFEKNYNVLMCDLES